MGFFTSAGTDFSTFANLFVFTGPIILSLFARFLLTIILGMTKPFHIEKLVTSANNITVTKIPKSIIWIVGIFFLSLDKT